MTLGQVIKQFREENNMSMEEFAIRSSLSKAYISMLERNKDPRGKAPSPRIETYDKVAKAIGVSVDDIMAVIDTDSSVTVNSRPESKKYEFLELGLIELGWRLDESYDYENCDFTLSSDGFSFGISASDLDAFANGIYEFINRRLMDLMEKSYKQMAEKMKTQVLSD